ncbi:MAG: hypothetical protein ABIR81_02510 [Ginsengibacter sp.]
MAYLTCRQMIEIFKTNITENDEALQLIEYIHNTFRGYKANFDLLDCDNILRIQSATGFIECSQLIKFLSEFGCIAELLTDEVPSINYR